MSELTEPEIIVLSAVALVLGAIFIGDFIYKWKNGFK